MIASEYILASASPRRSELMRDHGLRFRTVPAEVDETLPPDTDGPDAVMYLSLKKALWVESRYPEFAGRRIIAADTVVCTGRILGKPADIGEAREMITELRGAVHHVYTGVTLLVAGEPRRRCFCEGTEVFVRDISDTAVEEYIRTQEPYDKAGGYAIQGAFGKYIDHIDGDFENVVGLPCRRMLQELALL